MRPQYHKCTKPTEFAYPTQVGGFMALCYEHAQKHLEYSKPIKELLMDGHRLTKE